MRDHLLPVFGTMRLDEIRQPHIERLKANLVAKGLAKKSINNILGVLGTCLRHAVEAGHIDRLPIIRRLKQPQVDFDFLIFEEVDALVAAARDGWPRRAILFALRTGLRQGEERGLKWDDVDFRSGRVHVQRTISQDGNKTNPPKNDRTRWVA